MRTAYLLVRTKSFSNLHVNAHQGNCIISKSPRISSQFYASERASLLAQNITHSIECLYSHHMRRLREFSSVSSSYAPRISKYLEKSLRQNHPCSPALFNNLRQTECKEPVEKQRVSGGESASKFSGLPFADMDAYCLNDCV